MTEFSIGTEQETAGQIKVMRANSLDFQMGTWPGTATHPTLPVIVIDSSHVHRAFVKRTPWLQPGQYGTRYSVQWHMGIPFGHIALHVIFSNDETSERKEFWLTICPLQLYALKKMANAFKNISNTIKQTYGHAIKDTPVAIISEEANNALQGHTIYEVMNTPERQAWFEDNMVLVQSCDFTLYCAYFDTIWYFWESLPPTQPLVDQVSRFPCRYCTISIGFLKDHRRIVPYSAVKKFVESNPDFKSYLDTLRKEVEQELDKKVLERSEEMEKNKYREK